MVRIIIGSGDKRHVYEREDHGKAMHEQRRAIKLKLGLLH